MTTVIGLRLKTKQRAGEDASFNSYSHSVSSWLQLEKDEMKEDGEKEKIRQVATTTKKFYDELDGFSLLEEEVVLTEDGEDTRPVAGTTAPTEPSLSVRWKASLE